MERSIRQDLLESSRTAHAELRAALDTTRILTEQHGAQRLGELEAMLVQRFTIVEKSLRKVDHSSTQNTGHLETVVKYVSAIQQDARRHETEIKEVQQSVRELKQRTRAAVEGSLGLLAEAHCEKDHATPERTTRAQSPVWAESALGSLAPLAPLLQASKPLDLLPGLPEMTTASTAEDDGTSSGVQDLSRRSLSSLASSKCPAALPREPFDGEYTALSTPVPPASPCQLSIDRVLPAAVRQVSQTSSREAAPLAPKPGSGTAGSNPQTAAVGSKAQVPGQHNAARSPMGRAAPAQATLGIPTRRSPGPPEGPGGLRGISSDSGVVRTPSNDTVYSNRSLPARRAPSGPVATPSGNAYPAAGGSAPSSGPSRPGTQRSLDATSASAAPGGGVRQSSAAQAGHGPRGEAMWQPKAAGLTPAGFAVTQTTR